MFPAMRCSQRVPNRVLLADHRPSEINPSPQLPEQLGRFYLTPWQQYQYSNQAKDPPLATRFLTNTLTLPST